MVIVLFIQFVVKCCESYYVIPRNSPSSYMVFDYVAYVWVFGQIALNSGIYHKVLYFGAQVYPKMPSAATIICGIVVGGIIGFCVGLAIGLPVGLYTGLTGILSEAAAIGAGGGTAAGCALIGAVIGLLVGLFAC